MGASGVPSISSGHFFGTDDLGRDLYSRTIQATGTSLLVGLIGAGMALIIGIAWGVIAGFYGGRLDSIIIFRHILPNLMGVVIVYASLLVPDMILAESFISFLGLGISEPNTSLGSLISEGAGTMAYGTLWQLAFPLAFYVTIIITMFFIGDGLRDALDPKDR